MLLADKSEISMQKNGLDSINIMYLLLPMVVNSMVHGGATNVPTICDHFWCIGTERSDMDEPRAAMLDMKANSLGTLPDAGF